MIKQIIKQVEKREIKLSRSTVQTAIAFIMKQINRWPLYFSADNLFSFIF